MNEVGRDPVSRRAVLGASASALASLAGCLGNSSGGNQPEEREFDLTITRSGGALDATLDPESDTPGVVTVGVGDSVTFAVTNEASVPVGLHDHATDSELVLEPDASQTLQFTPTDSMVGRHEIEGYATEGGGGDDHGGDHDHDHGDGSTAQETSGSDDTGGHGGETVTLLTVEIRP